MRLVADLVRGMSVDEAEAHLTFLPNHAARPILKLLRSASKNGEMKGLNPRNLFISTILVEDGPISKRWMPRARGSASPLYIRSCHITIELAPIEERRLKRLTGITIKKEVAEVKKFKELEEKEELEVKSSKEEQSRKAESQEEAGRQILTRGRQKKGDVRFQKRGFLPKIFRRKSV